MTRRRCGNRTRSAATWPGAMATRSWPCRCDNSIAQWNRHMGILEGQLDKTGAFAAGAQFTLADIVLGLSVNRWLMTPMPRPDYPAIDAYLSRLLERPGFLEFGRNGAPWIFSVIFSLTRMVQRSKVSNALHPRSPRSSRVGTQSRPDMTRFQNVGSLLQPAPQARETRIPHTETHAKRVCAQRRFVRCLPAAERST